MNADMSSACTLAVDSWTSISNEEILALVLHCRDYSFSTSFEVRGNNKSETGVMVAKLLEERFENISEEFNCLVANNF